MFNNFYLKKTINGHVFLYTKPYNQWSPAICYVNHNQPVSIKSENIIQVPYLIENKVKRKLFWYLKTNSFDEYLNRRNNLSKQPQKNFPTLKNYKKKRNKVNGIIQVKPFEKDFFAFYHDKLKQEHFLSGNELIDSLRKNYPGLPKDWIKLVTLTHDNNIVAIFSIIDDGRSI